MEGGLFVEAIKEKNGDVLTVRVNGDLDIHTSPQLQAQMEGALGDVMTLIFDLSEAKYISSAGLRVLLGCYQKMEAKDGRMILRHVNESFKRVLKLTGFSDFLEMED